MENSQKIFWGAIALIVVVLVYAIFFNHGKESPPVPSYAPSPRPEIPEYNKVFPCDPIVEKCS